MDKRQRTFYLPDNLIRWIEEQAASEYRSANSFVQFLLEKERERREQEDAQPVAVA